MGSKPEVDGGLEAGERDGAEGSGVWMAGRTDGERGCVDGGYLVVFIGVEGGGGGWGKVEG